VDISEKVTDRNAISTALKTVSGRLQIVCNITCLLAKYDPFSDFYCQKVVKDM